MSKRKDNFSLYVEGLSKLELVDAIEKLHKRKKVSFKDIEDLFDKSVRIPASIFNPVLSSLESICKYMKENLGLSYHEIAELLNRDDRTIWTVYKHACTKQKKKFSAGKSGVSIPVKILADRKLSVLENIAYYLKEKCGMKYSEIARVLNRDDRTIWTVYKRALKKK